ncbi:hypothetical protein MSG28_007558 [Choristoneura fumiferana]|uniref:Uncharacterized protein n=1 Tax=Choristoneura fumiferana TaxID=7141 RepID=A0ACC0JXQ2_CHOFU|nr:hypothetical protein MSG28_007558 [Choristoneura fumiferana]
MPAIEDYWSNDFRFEPIASDMRLKRYKCIKRDLHFCDNANEDPKDSYHKLSTAIEYVHKQCLKIEEERSFAIEEMLIPYKCKKAGHRKQYNPKKPHKWGFKFLDVQFTEWEENYLGVGAKTVVRRVKLYLIRLYVQYISTIGLHHWNCYTSHAERRAGAGAEVRAMPQPRAHLQPARAQESLPVSHLPVPQVALKRQQAAEDKIALHLASVESGTALDALPPGRIYGMRVTGPCPSPGAEPDSAADDQTTAAWLHPTLPETLQLHQDHVSTAGLEMLSKLFPGKKRSVLELVLRRCNHDLLRAALHDKTVLASAGSSTSFEGSVSSSAEVESRWSAFRPVGPRPLLPALVMGRVCGSEWLVPLPALPALSVLSSRLCNDKKTIDDVTTIYGICTLQDCDLSFCHMRLARLVRDLDFARYEFYVRTGIYQRSQQLRIKSLQGLLVALAYMFWDVNYFLRVAFTIGFGRLFQKKCGVNDTSTIYGFCTTQDVDIFLRHMNNARYVRELDFARFHFYDRTGIYANITAAKGHALQGASSIRYRRTIPIFSAYKVETRNLIDVNAETLFKGIPGAEQKPQCPEEITHWLQSIEISSAKLRKKD